MAYNYDYFISYAHKDNVSEDGKPGFVDEFVEKLKSSPEHHQMFGRDIEVFFDKSEIHSMSDWENRIRSKLAESRFFVVLLSPNYFKSEFCAKEFDWWMQHEMHRRVLGEGTAPMLIVAVDDLYNFNVNPLPVIPPDIQVKFPDWVKQIRQIQAGPDFDMHNLDRQRIDEILRALCENTKDKVFKQDIAEQSPINAGYPQYNKNFVGRRENLRSLRQTLSTSCTTAISAVNGLGGIGKTELALTYGHAFAWDYELGRVFATCENSDSLEDVILSSSIAEMHGLKLEGTNEQKLTTLYNELKSKIKFIEKRNEEKHIDRTLGAHVLLILDNVNRLELISQRNLNKLPKFFHVIITTRESANDFPYIHTERVDRLSEDESVELLSNLRPFGSDEKEVLAAREIAKLLDGFTLAVELTGAYLSRSPRVTYQKQYKRLKTNISDTMETMADKTQELQGHQAQCISAVLESTLSELSDNAHKALEFAALMPPDAVGFGWLPELLALDEDEGLEVLDELTGYNLLTPLSGEPNIARIHRLVAETVKHEIPEAVQKKIIAKIRDKCNELLHKDKTFWCTPENSWNITPVFEFSLALAEQWTVEASEKDIDWNLTWMNGTSGNMLNALGKMNEARKVYQQVDKMLEERANTFPNNVDTQRDLSALVVCIGYLEQTTGNAAAARELFEKALEIDRQLAEKMPDNIEAQLNLLRSFDRLRNLEKAIGNLMAVVEWDKKQTETFMQKANLSLADMSLADMNLADMNLADMNLADMNLADPSFLNEILDAITSGNYIEMLKLVEKTKKAVENFPCLADLMLKYLDIPSLRYFYNAFGDMASDLGLVATARDWYEKDLEICKQHADKMPENVDAQRNLSVSYYKLGDLEQSAGNDAAARDWYEKGLETFNWLADLMPDNVVVQQYLNASYCKLGDLEQSVGNAAAARDWYKKTLEISKQLAEKMPDNVDAQRNLSVSYYKLGDLEQSVGNAAAARDWYEKSLEIDKRLADLMLDNFDVQQNFSASCYKLGDLEQSVGNVVAAREWYEKAMEIFKRFADLMPDNIIVQRNLCISYNNLGDLEKAVGNVAATREWYEKALKIDLQLAGLMPDGVDIQQILCVSYNRLGDLENDAGNIPAAREWYMKALEVLQRLVDKSPDNIDLQKDLAETQEKIDKLQK